MQMLSKKHLAFNMAAATRAGLIFGQRETEHLVGWRNLLSTKYIKLTHKDTHKTRDNQKHVSPYHVCGLATLSADSSALFLNTPFCKLLYTEVLYTLACIHTSSTAGRVWPGNEVRAWQNVAWE